jgi:redox-sensitive bicupin YhaK (pirin superfamily)
MQANSTFIMPKTVEGINRTLYFYKGNQLNLEGQLIPNYHAIDVISDEDIKLESGNESIKILVLQGRPINEPVVQHGPFVMNTKEEIVEAFNEYQQTQFGGWPFERYDKVHDRNLGRFARYTDGREEVKD